MTPQVSAVTSARARRWYVWAAAAFAVVALPHLFTSGAALTQMSLMGIMVIFALSYNMLLGGTGLLSFGHAVYYGLAGFLAVHGLNLIGAWQLPVPVPLIPLLGGAAGLLFGVLFGSVSTRRAGTAFAMISLGIGELVAAGSMILRGFFGGEDGITANRTVGPHPLGLSLGPQIEVYYLIAAWCLVCTAAMYWITRTPLGRICLAVRENPERAQFIGYDTQRVRFFAFSLSGFFAGIAGGLAAINFEIMTASAVGAVQSGMVLLMTFIGGVGHFAGPIIGAVLMTLLQVSLSDVTGAWMLYVGLLFVLTVMYAPSGIAGLLWMHRPAWRAGLMRRLLPSYARALVPCLALLCGVILFIEMSYQIAVLAAEGTTLHIASIPIDAGSALPWGASALLTAAGAWSLARTRPRVLSAWDAVTAEVRRRGIS